mmetsp:Transcript_10717/g.30434  ORF Transcript_10717/g.30434 Transcript_10717/m.30434 type:complete len:115 (+) Transcript_10717:2-346(+)
MLNACRLTPSAGPLRLQDSLGGDAKALMLCNLAQPAAYAQETLSSLVFASKVSSVVMKTPQRHLEDGADPSAAPVGVTPSPRSNEGCSVRTTGAGNGREVRRRNSGAAGGRYAK